MNLNYSQADYVFDVVKEQIFSEDAVKIIRSLLAVQNIYLSATREIETKLENLNDEFKYTMDRNPIHQIKTRVKTPDSIVEKLSRKGYEISVESARKNLNDIAGVRVICSYINDIYMIADLLTSQDDIQLLKTTDYIENPKPNGYRSLHLIVTVLVFLSKKKERVKAEIQIRTIAMDFWASLEHELAYKIRNASHHEISAELKSCADVIASTDLRMQKLYNRMRGLSSNPAR